MNPFAQFAFGALAEQQEEEQEESGPTLEVQSSTEEPRSIALQEPMPQHEQVIDLVSDDEALAGPAPMPDNGEAPRAAAAAWPPPRKRRREQCAFSSPGRAELVERWQSVADASGDLPAVVDVGQRRFVVLCAVVLSSQTLDATAQKAVARLRRAAAAAAREDGGDEGSAATTLTAEWLARQTPLLLL